MAEKTKMIPRAPISHPLAGLISAALLTLGLCGGALAQASGTSPSIGSTLYNLFYYGGTTVPPSQPGEPEEFECPAVEILDGTAALRQEAAGGVRYQYSMGQTARECQLAGDQIVIKIGIEGRALLGTAGSPGTFAVPVRFVVKRGDKVLASRLQRQSVTIPPNDTQASFVMIEQGIQVPKSGDADLQILVGFDNGGAKEPAKPKTKKKS
jgi:hypothetical protein